MPSSTARWMAATDSASSWVPQPPCEALPPIAHVPSPSVVMSNPVPPSERVGKAMSLGSREGALRSSRPRLAAGGSCQTVEDAQRLGDDLIHVVVLVRREATDESDIRRLLGQELVPFA